MRTAHGVAMKDQKRRDRVAGPFDNARKILAGDASVVEDDQLFEDRFVFELTNSNYLQGASSVEAAEHVAAMYSLFDVSGQNKYLRSALQQAHCLWPCSGRLSVRMPAHYTAGARLRKMTAEAKANKVRLRGFDGMEIDLAVKIESARKKSHKK